MTNGPFAAVVDASVGIKLFVAEPLSNDAHALFAHLADDPPAQLFVPDLFYIECTNILWKYTRRLGLPPPDARLFVERLGQLAITAYSTASLMADALDIAMEQGLTAYDAAYVALARQLSLPLVTADGHLVDVLAETKDDIRRLGDVEAEML